RVAADRDLRDREVRQVPVERDGEIRVPVEREDAVVLKKGEDGRDEIIIRKPVGGRDVRP
ncbi:MAG TPA: hypothetical protein VFS59_19410, partial [Gemmatimonadaceae bacterium]|nr:hypothetical protein [Gemmatimonadaceae bacterium]